MKHCYHFTEHISFPYFFQEIFNVFEFIYYAFDFVGSRLDTNEVDDAISVIGGQSSGATETDDFDVAMGSLMAYGGKFLREIGLWAFEHIFQTNTDFLDQSPLPDTYAGIINKPRAT